MRHFTNMTARMTLVVGVCCISLFVRGRPAAASDPIVTQEGDTLMIVGDGYANSVTIIGSNTTEGTVGVFVVDVAWVYTDVSDIIVDLRGGDDYVGLDRIDISGTLVISTGNGHNEVRVGGLGYGTNSISDGVSIVGGTGQDEITVQDCVLMGDVTIYTFGGNDEVQWGAPVESDGISGLDVSLLGGMYVSTGDGHDRFEMWNAGCGPDDLTIDTGTGDDQVGLGAGYSSWAIYGNWLGNVLVSTGAGADDVVVADSTVNGDAIIECGDQSDLLILGAFGGAPNQFDFGSVDAHGGKGQDTLLVDDGNDFAHEPSFKSFELP